MLTLAPLFLRCSRTHAKNSHGFAWEEGADVGAHILPLLHYVKNVNRTDDGGYYGK